MDGVIVDSELHWHSLEGYFLKSLIPTWTAADQGRIIGLSLPNSYSLLKSEYGLQTDEQEFLARYHDMATQIYSEKTELLPGFSRTLAYLQGIKMPLAVASSSHRSWIELVLDKFELHDAFEVVVSADEVGGKGKPAPDIYLYTAGRLGVKPEECTVIEDSRNGVLSAKSAGMFCIGIRNGFNEEQDISAADVIIEGFGQLDLGS
jgi:HAD superfamily hydrolase (TIGR01509 family)